MTQDSVVTVEAVHANNTQARTCEWTFDLDVDGMGSGSRRA